MIPSFEETRFVRFLVVCLLSIIHINSGQQCFDDGNEFCIDENDILSVDLLPGSFLFADQETSVNATKSIEDKIVDGSIHDAITEMEYHRYVLLKKKIIQIFTSRDSSLPLIRKRMNEYLCHGYMAEEIAKLMRTPRVKRRLDAGKDDLYDTIDNVTVHDKLLADEGSSKYKNWLQR